MRFVSAPELGLLAAGLVAVTTFASGCSSPPPSPARPSVREAIAACQEASRQWRTLLVRYESDSGPNDELTIGVEQGGAIALRFRDRSTKLLSNSVGAGQELAIAFDGPEGREAIRLPMGRLMHLMTRYQQGIPLEESWKETQFDPVSWRLDAGIKGDAGPALQKSVELGVGPSGCLAFLWLDRLSEVPEDQVEIHNDVIIHNGPVGRSVIDRRTGVLVEVERVDPNGERISFRLKELKIDLDLPRDLFSVEGTPVPETFLRRALSKVFVEAFAECVSGKSDLLERKKDVLAYTRILLALTWTSEERARLAAVGTERSEAEVRHYQSKDASLTREEIRPVADQVIVDAINAEIGPEFWEDIAVMWKLSALPVDQWEVFRADYWQVWIEELVEPAIRVAKERE